MTITGHAVIVKMLRCLYIPAVTENPSLI